MSYSFSKLTEDSAPWFGFRAGFIVESGSPEEISRFGDLPKKTLLFSAPSNFLKIFFSEGGGSTNFQ